MLRFRRSTFDNSFADWLVRHFLLALIGMAAVVHFLAALHGKRNLDEFQFVANGWDIYRGLAPYRDFWDNHGPLPNYFFALPFLVWPATHEVFYPLRLVAFFISLCNVALTGWAARIAFPNIRYAGRLAAALLLCAPLYLIKAREIRGDIFLMVAWCGALVALLYGLRYRREIATTLGGFLCGAALWSTPKGLFIIFCGALILAADSLYRRSARVRHWIGFGAGVFGSIAALAFTVFLLGIHGEFFELAFAQSVGRPRHGSISAFTSTIWTHPFWMALALAAIGQGALATYRRNRLFWAERVLWSPALFIIVYYFFLLPSRNPQSLLPLHPLVALLGVALTTRMFTTFRRLFSKLRKEWVLCLIVLAMTALLLSKTLHLREVRGDFHRVINYANQLAISIPPGDTVLSGEGPPCFRPSALWYHVLVEDVRKHYALGKLPFNIPTELQRKSVRWIAMDPRLRTLPVKDRTFFQENYLPMARTQFGNKHELLAAGKVLPLKPEPTSVTIAIARHYWLTDDQGREISLLVDNQPTSRSVYLERGEHIFAAIGHETTVVLSSRWPSRLNWESIRSSLPPVSLRK